MLFNKISEMKTAFWDAAPCTLVDVYRRFRGTYCLHNHRPDGGGSKHLSNVGKLLPDYKMHVPEDNHLHIRRREILKSHPDCRCCRV
jgi:hypothetical protein